MARPTVVVLRVGLTLTALGFAEAQQPAARIAKIGFLSSGTAYSGSTFRNEVFHQQLRKLGYVGGKNIAFESRYGEDNFERLPAVADELVRLKVDVLVTNSTPAALAAKNATRTIPIVFLGVSDPVVARLVDSLSRPGGNVTGFTNIAPVLAGKRLGSGRAVDGGRGSEVRRRLNF